VLTALAGLVALVVAADHLKRILPRAPPINWGDTIVGVGQALQNSPKDFILSQQTVFGKGKTFGLRLIASTIYFIAGNGADLDVMKNDEYRASFNTLRCVSFLSLNPAISYENAATRRNSVP
jgi:hypothetical protein